MNKRKEVSSIRLSRIQVKKLNAITSKLGLKYRSEAMRLLIDKCLVEELNKKNKKENNNDKATLDIGSHSAA